MTRLRRMMPAGRRRSMYLRYLLVQDQIGQL